LTSDDSCSTFITTMTVYTSHALRPATGGDVEAIAGLWHDGWRDGHLGHVPDDVLPHRRLDGFLHRTPGRIPQTTVATVDDRIVGFVTVADDEVEQLYVAAEARGSGAAVTLLDHAEGVLAQTYDRAWLAVVAGNARARRFYERRGWAFARALDDHTADGVVIPSLRYEKALR
jgi:GNAT superfamily N-acetyltransferase